MSEQLNSKSFKSIFGKTEEEELMEKYLKDVPSWVFECYTAKEWMWLPEEERRRVLTGNTNRTSSWYEEE